MQDQGQVKQLKNILMMQKMFHWSQSKNKIFNELADESLEKIVDLDKKS